MTKTRNDMMTIKWEPIKFAINCFVVKCRTTRLIPRDSLWLSRGMVPGDGPGKKIGRGCATRFPKPYPIRPRYTIFHTLFENQFERPPTTSVPAAIKTATQESGFRVTQEPVDTDALTITSQRRGCPHLWPSLSPPLAALRKLLRPGAGRHKLFSFNFKSNME